MPPVPQNHPFSSYAYTTCGPPLLAFKLMSSKWNAHTACACSCLYTLIMHAYAHMYMNTSYIDRKAGRVQILPRVDLNFLPPPILSMQDIGFLWGCDNSGMSGGMHIIQKTTAKWLKADVTILSSVLSSEKVMPSAGFHCILSAKRLDEQIPGRLVITTLQANIFFCSAVEFRPKQACRLKPPPPCDLSVAYI